MPKKVKNFHVTEGRSTRSRTRSLLGASVDEINFNGLHNTLNNRQLSSKIESEKTYNNLSIENKLFRNVGNEISDINTKPNGHVHTATIRNKCCQNDSGIYQFILSMKLESENISYIWMYCIYFIYISLTQMSHLLLLQNRVTHQYFNINYVVGAQVIWSLLMGTISDFVSIKVTCLFKVTGWLIYLIFSFTIYEEVTEAFGRILVCSSFLFWQIALYSGSTSCIGLSLLSAIRLLVDYQRFYLITIINRIQRYILDLDSHFIASEWIANKIIFLCFGIGAMLCLIYLSKSSLEKSRPIQKDNDDCLLKNVASAFISKIAITLQSILFLYNRKRFIAHYTNQINLTVIAVQFSLVPILSLIIQPRRTSQICFLLLFAVNSFLIWSSIFPFYLSYFWGGVTSVCQCMIVARITNSKFPGVCLSLLAVMHLYLRILANSIQQPSLTYYIKQLHITTIFNHENAMHLFNQGVDNYKQSYANLRIRFADIFATEWVNVNVAVRD